MTHKVRERLHDARELLAAWGDEVRQDPSRLWRTSAVRVGLYVAAGATLAGAAYWLAGAIAPRPSVDTEAAAIAKTATLYVVCTAESCRATYAVRRPRTFSEWPTTCEKCGATTLQRAQLCQVCRNWYALAPGGARSCPHCAAALVTSKPVAASRPADSDDAEDGW
jgi:hypothetical protein